MYAYNEDARIFITTDSEQLLAERVRTLYKLGLTGVLMTLGIAIVLVAMVAAHDYDLQLWFWLLGLASLMLLRAADLLSYRRELDWGNEIDSKYWLGRFATGTVATALAWNLFLLLFFPSLDIFSRAAVAVVYALMASASLLTLSASRWLGFIYIAAMLLPASLSLMFDQGPASLPIGLLGLLCFFLLIPIMMSSHRSAVHALMLARQNRELMQKAEQRQIETMALNDDLSLARSHLMEANANLEDKVRERTYELERLADEDPLTGLANRTCFVKNVHQAIQARSVALGENSVEKSLFAIYFVDLDRFKEINDGLGHPAGDLVLRTIAQRIQQACGDAVVCGRWGGDEFVLLQQGVANEDDLQVLGNRLLAKIGEPIDALRATVTVGASIGVAMYPAHGDNPDDLIEHADIAVYQAKRMGRSMARLYQPEWGQEARRRLDLVQSLRKAIEHGQLTLHFQPIVNTLKGTIFGFEALCRWESSEHGSISPGIFIPIAEESGLMPQLGSWVLRKACELTQRDWPNPKGPIIAVNVSVAQLLEDNFMDEVREILHTTGLQPQRLELELTESLFAERTEHVQMILKELRGMGVSVSIDDFGTGYSSMSYLRKFPVDLLKVDRSFVKDDSVDGDAILLSIIQLAHNLDLEVIVEGVETQKELQRVMSMGAHHVQGFFFAKPMPSEQACVWTVPQLTVFQRAANG